MQAQDAMMLFARREKGYMMRSERRSSYNRSPRGKRPRRGRGYAYGVFSVIVSVIVWPLGMPLLWTRKLRWDVGVKLLTSLLTLILCLCWMGWALTVQTDDYRITRVQDSINTALADSVNAVSETVTTASRDIAAFSSDIYAFARVHVADGIVYGVELADNLRETVTEVFASIGGGEDTDPAATAGIAPDASPDASGAAGTPSPSPTAEPAPTAFASKTPAPTQTATESATATATATRAATTSPAATAASTKEPTAPPTDAPSPSPRAMEDITRQMAAVGEILTREGSLRIAAVPPTAEPTETPTAEPTAEPTEAPTAEPAIETTVEPTPTLATPSPARETAVPAPLDLEAEPTSAPTLKPAGDAIVYHSSNGVGYHVRSSCRNMSGAKPHSLAESVADGFRSCRTCKPPAEELLTTEEPVVWVDSADIYHVSDECALFDGQYRLMTLRDAYEKGIAPCAACGAESYVYTPAAETPTPEPTEKPTPEPTEEPTPEPTAEPTPEPTAEPTPEPTAEPTPEPTEEPTAEPTEEPTPEPTEEPTPEPTEEPTPAPTPSVTLKPAGEAIVYHTRNGKSYHVAAKCKSMSGAKPYALAESVADGYGPCGICHPAPKDLVETDEPVVWVDTRDVYHTSDECASFDGRYRLMTLAEAYAQNLAPCPDCGAEEYRFTPEPTVAPTPEPAPEAADAVPAFAQGTPAGALKAAGDAIVYHSRNGKAYHMASRCGSMSGAEPYTLAESIADGFRPCGICKAPAMELLDVPVVWIDAEGLCHNSDTCAYFEGKYTLKALADAVSEGLEGCPFCGTGDLLAESASRIAAEREQLLEISKTVTVYYNNNSRFYHAADKCVNMSSADPHSLYDALDKGLKRCNRCEPPTLEELANLGTAN